MPKTAADELERRLAAALAQNRELVTELRIRDGIISDLQDRLAAYDFPRPPQLADWRRWRQIRRAKAAYAAYYDWRNIDRIADE